MKTSDRFQVAAALGSAAIVALCLFGCSTTKETTKISLPSNATTGFSWNYTMDNEGVLTETASDYVVDDSGSGKMGVGGTQVYEFTAGNNGTVTIDFVYGRPWEQCDNGTPKPHATYTYSVQSGKIAQTSAEEEWS